MSILPVKWIRLRAILNREPWWAEFWAALGALSWALCSFLIPVGTDQLEAFQIVMQLAGEGFWQLTGAFIGAWQVVVLFVNSRTWRRVACFAASWWWMFLVLAIALSKASVPSLGLYTIMALINLFSLVRLHREIP